MLLSPYTAPVQLSTASALDPSSRTQSFMNCFSMCPLHGVQFFSKCSSMWYSPSGMDWPSMGPTWATAPARTLLLRGLTMVCSFLQGMSIPSSRGTSMGCRGYLLHCKLPWTVGRQSVSPWSSPWAAVESLLQHLQHLHPSFFSGLGVCRAVSLTFFLLLFLISAAKNFFTLSCTCFPRSAPLTAEWLSSTLQWVH